MSDRMGKALFGFVFVAFFIGMMLFVSGGHWGSVLFSAPILLVAEAIYFGNQYLNIFLDGHEEEEAHEAVARVTPPSKWHHDGPPARTAH